MLLDRDSACQLCADRALMPRQGAFSGCVSLAWCAENRRLPQARALALAYSAAVSLACAELLRAVEDFLRPELAGCPHHAFLQLDPRPDQEAERSVFRAALGAVTGTRRAPASSAQPPSPGRHR